MRPGQNKRMRGRNNHGGGRKGPNPLTRSYESNGPDVKIRGTAQHIAEKYLQLARDAQSSGDPVMAESYLQHAEHYYRVIAGAQAAQQQAMGLVPRPAQEVDDDDDGIEEDDRFASVADRLPQPPQMQQPAYNAQPQQGQQPYQGQPNGGYGERQPYQGGQRPWRDNNRQDNRQQDNQNRQDNPNRQDRDNNRQDFRGENRGEGFRNEGGERQDRGQDRNQDRPWRNDQRRGPRPEQAELPVDAAAALPAFITGSRPPSDPPVPAVDGDPGAQENAEGGYHLRPRRRRRPRTAQGEGFGENEPMLPQTDPVPASE